MVAPRRSWPQHDEAPVPKSGKIGEDTGNSHAETVLVVDDEWLVRWSLSESLGDAGYRVRLAQDAREAVELFQRAPSADAVLLDLRLPDSSDLNLLKRLRQMAPRCSIILITAYPSAELAEQAERAGAFRVLDKPFDVDHVVTVVREALAQRRPNGDAGPA